MLFTRTTTLDATVFVPLTVFSNRNLVIPITLTPFEIYILADFLLKFCRMYRIGSCVVFVVKFLCMYNLEAILSFGQGVWYLF